MRFLSTLLVASLAALGTAAPQRGWRGWRGNRDDQPSDLPPAPRSTFHKIPHQYIVVLKDNVTETDFDAVDTWSTAVNRRHLAKRGDIEGRSRRGRRYRWRNGAHRFNGFAGEYDDDAIKEIATHPEVAFIEQASTVSIQVTQVGAPWGIARASKSFNDLIGHGGARYNFDASAGEGTTVYVIDTGINEKHDEFEGRATFGGTTIDVATAMTDEHGHGTHVAATIAGKTYGIAKKAKVVAYKVLDKDGNGSNQDVLEALDKALAHAEKNNVKVPIINMSLGGGKSDAVNLRIAAAVRERGAIIIAAAGNQGEAAAGFSPASAEEAITVGATDFTDTRASFSNFGPEVDIFAPGVEILSANIGSSNKETKLMQGTSMAAPHVAGVAAYFAGLGHNTQQVRELLLSKAHQGIVKNPSGSANRLLFNGGGARV